MSDKKWFRGPPNGRGKAARPPPIVKEFVRKTTKPKKIDTIQFGLMSGVDMVKASEIPVVSRLLYQMPSRKPAPYSCLDPRLGVSNKADVCQTCQKRIQECAGHYGYIKLELPVYHIGFFKKTYKILQSICKRCSRVLVTPEEHVKYSKRMKDPKLGAPGKSALAETIVKLCRPRRLCPWCHFLNGDVKHIKTSVGLKIVMECIDKRGDERPGSKSDFLKRFDEEKKLSSEVAAHVHRAQDILTPTRALELFKNIPDYDLTLLWTSSEYGRPEHLVLTHLLVPPVCVRPSVAMDGGGGSNEDDLTVKLQEIITYNDALRVSIQGGARFRTIQSTWDSLQMQVGNYLNGELPLFPSRLRPKKPIRGLCQRLKGKQGRFRGNLSGKRVDFSGRTVIGPDPNLPIFEVGVPLLVAKKLTYPERVTSLNKARLQAAVRNGTTYPGANNLRLGNGIIKNLAFGDRNRLASHLKIGDVVERHVIDGDIVLFNRQPSLHKMSIMAHRVRVLEGRTFRFNECVCAPYNADFDGDEMNLHLPQTEEARAEASSLMEVRANLITPRSGEPLISATQDFITASYLITQRNIFFDRETFCQVVSFLSDADEQVEIPMPAVLKPVPLWTGKQVWSLLLNPTRSAGIRVNVELKARGYTKDKYLCPEDGYVCIRNGELLTGNLDKAALGSSKKGLIYVIIRDVSPDAAAKVMLRMTKMSTRWLSNYGFSIGIEDVMPHTYLTQKKEEMLDDGYSKCSVNINQFKAGKLELQPGCDMEQSLESNLNGILGKLREAVGKMCVLNLPFHNAPRIMADCGSKGSTLNICQMIACVGQQAVNGARIPDGFLQRSLPIFPHNSKTPAAKGFVANSFFTGLTATEFFFHTMGGREGLVDTAVKTAETGYMQRRMMKALEDLSVQYDWTVRSSNGDVVQFTYGDDGLDPAYMEDNDRPVDFRRLFINVCASNPCIEERALTPAQLRVVARHIPKDPRFRSLLPHGRTFVREVEDFLNAFADRLAELRQSLGLGGLDLGATEKKRLEEQAEAELGQSAPGDITVQQGAVAVKEEGQGPPAQPALRARQESHDSYMSYNEEEEGAGMTAVEALEAEDAPLDLEMSAPPPRALVGALAASGFAYVRGESAPAMLGSDGKPRESSLDDMALDMAEAECIIHNTRRITRTQLHLLLEGALYKYKRAKVHPGEAAGAIAAHSLGEPATQMTLKTFHFAGVASMNVTLGVPRIKEIMNASAAISTPIIEAVLVSDRSEVAARIVKARIEKTVLGEVAEYIREVHGPDLSYLQVKLDMYAIQQLHLDVNAYTVRTSILKGKLKLKEKHVIVENDDMLRVLPPDRMYRARGSAKKDPVRGEQYFALQTLKVTLPQVQVQGIPAVSRAVISHDDAATADGKGPKYKMLVEGYDLLKVMGTAGVDGLRTISNHIIEVFNTLGVEAARTMIMRELAKTYGSYGIGIDQRHLHLLADVMTYKGQVLGITRHGIAKMKDSVLMLASFERTNDHLFDAAVHSRVEKVEGVSECIIMGMPIPLGTGLFKFLHKPPKVTEPLPRPPLLLHPEQNRQLDVAMVQQIEREV